MVDIMGHVAMGLLFAIPAWFVWQGRVSLAFVGLTAVTSLLPDIDLVLSRLFPAAVHHHGVTHTVVFVVLASLVAAVIVAATLTDRIDDWLGWHRFDAWSLFGFSFGAFTLGGLSHLFADMLSAPDISTPIEPFWPFFDKPWSIDLLWYNSIWWNLGLLTVAVVLHGALVYANLEPIEHPARFRRT